MVVSIPLRVCKGAVRHLAGHARTMYVSRRIWKKMKIPVRGPHDARAAIARVPMESCELFNQTISIQTCKTLRGP